MSPVITEKEKRRKEKNIGRKTQICNFRGYMNLEISFRAALTHSWEIQNVLMQEP